MLNAGRILEASELGVEYINAVMGDGKENFGLKTHLTSVTTPVWLPLNILEVLLYELKEVKENPTFSEVRNFPIVYMYFFHKNINRNINTNFRAIKDYKEHYKATNRK